MSKRVETIIKTCILALLVVIVNLVVDKIDVSADLTEDGRFSFSESTNAVLDLVEEPIYIRVLLSGQFPAGFERLEEATQNLLAQLEGKNANIQYQFEDPSDGSVEEVNQRYETLRTMGIYGTNLIVQDDGQMSERIIFPYAIINKGKKTGIVNLLKAQEAGESEDQTLNKSISLLEYKFADQIYKMTKLNKPNIVLLEGRGELPEQQTATLEQTIGKLYDVGRINMDSIIMLSEEIDLVIVARPTQSYSPRDQLILDQYIMRGGKVIWIVEKYEANVFAIDSFENYVPKEIVHNLDDMFFNYGVRMKSNLVLDLQCSNVPQVVAMQGGKPQTSLFPWFYHPILVGKDNHPITNNISNVNLTFPSEIEVLDKQNSTAIPLLETSPNSRYQVYPMRLSFDVVRLGEDPSKFNKQYLDVAVLREGVFDSHFKNRLAQDQEQTLKDLDMPFQEISKETKQIWITDASIMSNLYNPKDARISPIGFNQWDQKVYEGNREFMMNAIDYMVDDINVMDARNKDVKLRLLNRAKVIEEKTKWQLLNMALPLVVLGLFGLLYAFIRKKKYANPITD